MAATICEANPRAVVLVMCLEFCSLHLQVSDEPDSIVANSLFADGAGCAIVSAREPAAGRSGFRVGGFHSALIPSSESHMAWEIGNQGFNMILSSYVPDLIGANVRSMMEEMLAQRGHSLHDIDDWAVHPGGPSILDKVQASLGLDASALDVSRKVLREYGNMSSATILFVLKEMLAAPAAPGSCTLAMAFGPGLTVETALLERVDQPGSTHEAVRRRHRLLLEAAGV
jgi:predicted naringenin-chalcone synthase